MISMEDLKEPIDNIRDNAEKLVESQLSYLKLWAFKVIMKSKIRILQFLLLFFFVFMAILFLSFALGILLGKWLDSMVWGFVIVGGTYLIVIPLIIWLALPKMLEKPMLRIFSKVYLDD